ncbi:MAG TPA: glycosyltransferase [Candidatus Atribacteria bacterium]|nr:glycosyltransferase [Candidatus Atribacteria bacterium]
MAAKRKNKKSNEKDKSVIGRVKTSVVITLLNDFRVKRTLDSLLSQNRLPDEIVVADGGSKKEIFDMLHEYEKKDGRIRIYVLPGSVAETRNKVLPLLRGDIIIFLDADEIAPSDWLSSLIKPIENGEADFVGGPTKSLKEPKNKCEEFVNNFSRWFYENVVSKDISMLPMGNTAWRKEIFETTGGFDEKLKWGGEDYDINLRALASGFKGMLVKEAWVWHDQSHLDSLGKIFRKKYKYSIGATLAYFKSRDVRKKIGRAAKTSIMYFHPIELMNFLIKPFAFARGYMIWKKLNQT